MSPEALASSAPKAASRTGHDHCWSSRLRRDFENDQIEQRDGCSDVDTCNMFSKSLHVARLEWVRKQREQRNRRYRGQCAARGILGDQLSVFEAPQSTTGLGLLHPRILGYIK